MKKYLNYLFLLSLLIIISHVNAQTWPGLVQACGIIEWVRNILGVFIILAIIFAGYRLLSGGGDPKSLQDAKTTIIIVLIGGSVIALAHYIVQFFIGFSCP